jgi:hypothetical protein
MTDSVHTLWLFGFDDIIPYLCMCYMWLLISTCYYFMYLCSSTLLKCVCCLITILLFIRLFSMVDTPVVFPYHYAIIVKGGDNNWIVHMFCSLSLHLDIPPILVGFVNNQPESEMVKWSDCYVGWTARVPLCQTNRKNIPPVVKNKKQKKGEHCGQLCIGALALGFVGYVLAQISNSFSIPVPRMCMLYHNFYCIFSCYLPLN